LSLETSAHQLGYEEGLTIGLVRGRTDGQTLGDKRGQQLAEELAFYLSFAAVLTLITPPLPCLSTISSLLSSCRSFPYSEPMNPSIDEKVMEIRAKFKLIIKKLGLEKSFKVQNNNEKNAF
jgi:hypothetical protein